jgi:hypothetical protein
VVFSGGPNDIESIADRVLELAALPVLPPPFPTDAQPAASMATAAAAHPARNHLAFTAKSPYLAGSGYIPCPGECTMLAIMDS